VEAWVEVEGFLEEEEHVGDSWDRLEEHDDELRLEVLEMLMLLDVSCGPWCPFFQIIFVMKKRL
jgi:hypothetical protein